MFGQAMLGMIDLALESFSRSRVFAVLLNPCFLARLGIDRGQAMTWLAWAESLGIYRGWDADEKAQQGYRSLAALRLAAWLATAAFGPIHGGYRRTMPAIRRSGSAM